MNIFFTGAITGGRAQQPKYARIIQELEKYGTVFSKHVADERLSQYGETSISGKEILERELDALGKCDIVVADVTMSSLGAGYLIHSATSAGKRVIALYRGKDTLRLSGIIKGDALVEVYVYESDDDIQKILATIFIV